MARLITTIGIRPELLPNYEQIRSDSGNFSEWVCQRIQSWTEDTGVTEKRLDAYKRQLTTLKAQFKRLADNNGVVRREVNKNVDAFYALLDAMEGDL
jgi:nicotinic acid phosphoribosyltransferase